MSPTSARPAAAGSTLITVEELIERIDSPSTLIIDATVATERQPGGGVYWNSGITGHRAAHIPGAVHADILHGFSEPHAVLRFTRPTRARFEAAAQALGVRRESSIVVYDTGNSAFAARLWWLFRAFGHSDVVVLSGGLRAWQEAGLVTATGEEPRQQGDFVAHEVEGAFADRDEVLGVVHAGGAALISGLPPEKPTDPGFGGRRGRIPGTLTVPAQTLLDESGRILGDTGLASAFEGVDLSAPVVTYCGSGIAASLDALALVHLGAPDVRIYDGSLNEWALDLEAPLASEFESAR